MDKEECPSCGRRVDVSEFYQGYRRAKTCGDCRDERIKSRPLGHREELALEDLVDGRSPWTRYGSSADAPRTLNGLHRRGLIDDANRPTAEGRAHIARRRKR